MDKGRWAWPVGPVDQFGNRKQPNQGAQSPQFGGGQRQPAYGQPPSQGHQLYSPQPQQRQPAPTSDARAMGAMNAYAGLGSSGMNSMGQYGSNVANALTNQSIAAGNTYGQMANAYFNTLGQLGQVGAGLSAAGLNANSQSVLANLGGNMNMNVGGSIGGGQGGYGGFDVIGPDGGVASGLMGGGGGMGGSGFGVGGGGAYGANIQKGGNSADQRGMLNQGFGFLRGVQGQLGNRNSGPLALAGLAGNQFNMNRAATMDPRFMDSMNNMYRDSIAGVDFQSGMNRGSSGFGPMYDGQPLTQKQRQNPYMDYAMGRRPRGY